MSKETHIHKKIYHIVHISKLCSIIKDGHLYSDIELDKRTPIGITIGMNNIKKRRREELTLSSYPDLYVGECVPFYFCPRSVMLYLLYKGNHVDIEYRDGQEPIIHLVADLSKTVEWANANQLRWALTDSNAGARYFEDYTDLCDIEKLDWDSINATQWSSRDIKEKKQAEFLIENRFPWSLIEEIGVFSYVQQQQVSEAICIDSKKLPLVRIQQTWYY